MEGYDVVTSDDCKYGQVVGVQDGHVIVEHGTLRKSRHAVPETFATTNESENVVRLTVSKEIVEASPKLDGDSFDRQAVAEHYGLAESTPAPETEGYGDVLPDDPANSADTEALQAGRRDQAMYTRLLTKWPACFDRRVMSQLHRVLPDPA